MTMGSAEGLLRPRTGGLFLFITPSCWYVGSAGTGGRVVSTDSRGVSGAAEVA